MKNNSTFSVSLALSELKVHFHICTYPYVITSERVLGSILQKQVMSTISVHLKLLPTSILNSMHIVYEHTVCKLHYGLDLNTVIGITGLTTYRTADFIVSLFLRMVNSVKKVLRTDVT
jgi:hypothetical protein